MQTLARNGYTADEIKAALHASRRELNFVYYLLDYQNNIKKILDNIFSGSVENNALADIKRTAKFNLQDDGSIDFLKDRIKPAVRLKMPSLITNTKTFSGELNTGGSWALSPVYVGNIGANKNSSISWSLTASNSGYLKIQKSFDNSNWTDLANGGSLFNPKESLTGKTLYLRVILVNQASNISLNGSISYRILGSKLGGYAEFSQGVFILSTPPRKIDGAGVITRDVEAYDQLQILLDDKVAARYTITAGANYITEVKTLLDGAGITLQNLTATDKTLPVTQDWEIATSKLTIINDLLGAINYKSLWFNEEGVAIAQPYVSPSIKASEYTYITDEQSVIFPEAQNGLDLFKIPNRWILTVSRSDREPLVSVYTNTNAESPLSTVNRGRIIVTEPKTVEAVDQTTLDAMAQRAAFDDSQIYEEIEFKTAIMPIHSDADVLTLSYEKFNIDDKYSEVSWSYDLKAGAQMSHRVRKVVNV